MHVYPCLPQTPNRYCAVNLVYRLPFRVYHLTWSRLPLVTYESGGLGQGLVLTTISSHVQYDTSIKGAHEPALSKIHPTALFDPQTASFVLRQYHGFNVSPTCLVPIVGAATGQIMYISL